MITTSNRFIDIVTAPDPDINLAEAALMIARYEYPDLDVDAYLARLDHMAEEIMHRVGDEYSTQDLINELNHLLFVEEGFTGNEENFIDPRNSYLNEVMDRKLGIPITISLIYIAVGQRIGLPVCGVSFPGHFVVKLILEEGQIVLDPYAGGIPLSHQELMLRLTSIYDITPSDEELLECLMPSTNKEILARVLRNLKTVYLKSGDNERALSAVDLILQIQADDPVELRDRGRIYQDLDCFQAALTDYHRYLELLPDAWDVQDIQARAAAMQEASNHLH